MNVLAREVTGFRGTWRYARAGGTAMQLRFALIMLTMAACAGVWAWAAVTLATSL
jgi:hypothetical protein